MRVISALLATAVLVAALFVGVSRVGPLPPLGPLLDPANGIWHVAATAEFPRQTVARIPGLSSAVRVVYDDRGVPHIFASTESDAQRALGYVVARDRLFQLEIQSRAGAGTLTELLGPRLLAVDRDARALGLPVAAEWKLAKLRSAAAVPSAERRAPSPAVPLDDFASGVNAFIDELSPRDYPFEFKFLGRAPRRWDPRYSVDLFSRMAYTLSYNEDEIRNAEAAARIGRAAADAIYPVNSPIQEPIQPSSRNEPRTDFRAVPPPGKGDAKLFAVVSDPRSTDDVVIGSNNWAVSPHRTRSGSAMLAGDPHLELTLPSIWYEAHLVVPGALDAYGVTIPGAPSIIIGFNRDIAWTFTNTESDVLDRYVETLDDDAHPTHYKLDGKWRPLVARTEIYRDPSGRAIATDTIYWTHRGPMRRQLGKWISSRWTAADSSLNTQFFERAQHAHSAEEFMSVTAGYTAPAQNMLAADRSGTIAIRSTGAFPIRPGSGRGDLLRDGSTSTSDWSGYWPVSRYPQSVNPSRGYLSSNNQQPVDPADNPRYLGSHWFAPWRAIRINELMRADANVTMDDMRRWQTDPHSARAEFFVPAFLEAAHARPGDAATMEGARYLSQWSRTYTEDDQRAILFEAAMAELSRRVWDELRDSTGGARLATPDGTVLAELMQQPKNKWWDDRSTPKVVETRDDILAQALAAAYRKVVKEHGDADDGGWRWGSVRHANIMHLLRIPALSALLVPVQGGPSTLNPVSEAGGFGPSWRMVVEMGPEVHAMGTYPGGQSGNPASARYLAHLVTWSKGELDTLRFPKSEADLDRRTVTSVLTLTPAAK